METHSNHENKPPYLLITGPGGESATVALEANNSLFAGSGTNCRICLQGHGINPIHCMFCIDENSVLRVQDWNTDGRTLVNGQSVATETTVNSGDRIQIGDYVIQPVLSPQDQQRVENTLPDTSSQMESAEISDSGLDSMAEIPTDSGDFAAVDSPVEEVPASSVQEPNALAAELSIPETETSADAFEFDVDADQDLNLDWESELTNGFGTDSFGLEDSQQPDAAQGFVDPRDEELEMLRMEVEQLRFELAERDVQSPFQNDNLADQANCSNQEQNFVDDDQTAQLVNRLEELLVELQSSDERVRGLEELLQFSDQAAQAEQEERQQLESWVAEIEQRLSQREAESEAEMGRVLNRLKEAQAQHHQVETQLKKVLQSKGHKLSEASKDLIQKSRNQIQELQQRLEASKEENERLRQQMTSSEGEVKAREELQQMEQKLMQLEVETSRERADLARQRAELETLKDELNQKLNSTHDEDTADSRVRAMRQHLRDIHEEERTAEEEKRQRSLGGRISRLLHRVGR